VLEERKDAAETEHASGGGHATGHPSPKEYVRIGLILGVLTAIEVAVAYTDIPHAILIPTLFLLAIVKFALVVLWFMHLKFDDRRYGRFFVIGLSGAAILYLVVLISLRTFG
jgi:cytochrome c oxidase subunit 4